MVARSTGLGRSAAAPASVPRAVNGPAVRVGVALEFWRCCRRSARLLYSTEVQQHRRTAPVVAARQHTSEHGEPWVTLIAPVVRDEEAVLRRTGPAILLTRALTPGLDDLGRI